MNEIGDRIKKKCDSLKITVKELASVSGVNYKTLNRLVSTEDPNPTLDNLKRLSIALGLSIDNLVFGEENSTDEELSIILKDLESIDSNDKKRILYMIRMMIAESKNNK